jgi:hypothetical protein
MADLLLAPHGRLLVIAGCLGIVAAAAAIGAGPATAAPVVEDLGVTSGQTTVVTWRNPGLAYSSAEVQLSLAPDGTPVGPWATYANAPTATGSQTVMLDLRGFLGDGRHAVRLVAREGASELVRVAAHAAVIDSTPPVVSATFGPVVGGVFLPVATQAQDALSGLDLARGVSLEVAEYDRDRKTPTSPWRVAGDLRTTERGVGVDLASLPDGEYLGRVLLHDTCGLAGRSQPAWFSKQPAEVPAPPAPPTKLLLRGRAGGFTAHPGVQRSRRHERFAFEGQLRGPAGERLEGYRVTIRMASGKGYELTTGAGGLFRLSTPVTHGGVVRIRASRNGQVLRHDIVMRLTRMAATR